MPIQIDKFETDVEIKPGTDAPAAPSAPAAASSAATPSLRETVVAVLEQELEEYLRMRG